MAKDRRGRYRLRQQLLQRIGASFEGKVAASDIVRINGDTAAAQRLHVTLQAIMAQRHIFRAGDAADTLVSQLVKVVYRVKGRRQVIDVDGGQLQLRRELVRHDHRWQIALLFHAGVKRQARAEQHHAVNLLGDDKVDKGFFFLILVGAIAD
ncbi:hypothetical protein SB00610_04368 [Klebsiella quasipneumoniae subsp. similipneumoniae]|nr:hypothetical protein SB00610_04368 [Klebsiella quasipneumoniae subsp. similipneumoniae]